MMNITVTCCLNRARSQMAKEDIIIASDKAHIKNIMIDVQEDLFGMIHDPVISGGGQ